MRDRPARARSPRGGAPMSPSGCDAERLGSRRCRAERLASGPGLVAAAFGLTTVLDRRSTCATRVAVRLEPARPADAPAPTRRDAPDRHRRTRRAVGLDALAVRRPRQPVGLRAEPRSLSPRAAERGQPLPRRCSSSPPSEARLAEADVVPAVAAAGRGARAVGGPGHRRPRPRRDRPGARAPRGPAGRRDRRAHGTSARPSSGRPVAAASNRSSSSSSPTRSTRRRRLATVLADERRPLLRELAPRACTRCLRCARRSRAASIPVGRAARYGVAAAGRPPCSGPRRIRPAPAAARLARRRRARERAPGADRHAPQRPLCRPGQGRGAWPGEGHRPRRIGQRPDALHRAARRRRARQRLARGPGRRGGGDRPDPRRAVGASWRPMRPPSARRSMRLPGSTCGPRRRRSPPRWTPRGPRPPTDPRSSCCRRATRASPAASSRSTSASVTATRPSS